MRKPGERTLGAARGQVSGHPTHCCRAKSASMLQIMRTDKTLCVVALTTVLAGPLAGCAEYSAYRKCGSHGCGGDAKITAEARALLSQHPALGPPNQVYVRTMNQVVYLSGQVATDLQRESAESIATAAAGGHRVVDIIAL